MDELELLYNSDIVSYIKDACSSELRRNKHLKSSQEFYEKYSNLEKFCRKFKCYDLFNSRDIDNKEFQEIINILCPNIDFKKINEHKRLSNFAQLFSVFLIFAYLFGNEFYIMYKYHNEVKGKTLDSVLKKETTVKNNLNDSIKNLNSISNNIASAINNKDIDTKLDNITKEVNNQKEKIASLNLFLDRTISDYNNKLNAINYKLQYGSYFISNVPTINQYPNYPSGCESISLLILLRYAGVNVSAIELVSALKKTDNPHYVEDTRYGSDPEEYFIGDPTSIDGFGVYEQPIITLSSYFKAGIINITGSSLTEVLRVVLQGHPVQVWVAMDGSSTYYAYSWIDEESGNVVQYPSGFHSLVIIGFNSDQIITSDPATGSVHYFERSAFEKSYNFFGKRALYYE